MQIQEFEEGTKFIYLRQDELDGGQYYILRPAAKLLQNTDVFAATLLYRKMIQSVLEKAQSKYYHYGAADLVTCGILSSSIIDWKSLEDHKQYLMGLEVVHKRKVSFWSEYESALQKQATRDLKAIVRSAKNKAL